MNEIAASIVALNERLKGVPFEFAFLGGSVLSLLVNDPTADTIRVTKDIDILANIRTRTAFHREERTLEARGFRHDTSEDAPICRWIADGIVVDVLPVREEVLGWKSRWFEEALKAASVVEIEAFEDRGRGDFICSTDFEDVICLFNGRTTLVNEIIAEATVCPVLAGKFATYLENPDVEDAVMGFVQTESRPEDRFAAVMTAFRKLADVKI